MRALNDVIESGKVRYIGASSVRLSLSSIFYCDIANMRLLDGRMGIPNA